MSELNTKLIEKIQKLLALATSSNEHEAKLAAAKAQELLVSHNLDMQAVEHHTSDYTKEELLTCGLRHRPPEAVFIHLLLVEYFFVEIIRTNKNFNCGESTYVILGEKTNLRVALYMHAFLTRAFKEQWALFKKEGGISGSAPRQSFYWGLCKGIKDQLAERRMTVEQSRGLVLVRDPGLDGALAKHFPKLKEATTNIKSHSEEAVSNGYERGKKLRLAFGIEHETKKSGRLLK